MVLFAALLVVMFLNVYLGGVGAQAHRFHSAFYGADDERFAAVSVHIDTDRGTRPDVDVRIPISLSANAVKAIKANAPLLGSNAARAAANLFTSEDVSSVTNGSKTLRAVTQIGWKFNRGKIIRKLQKAIALLMGKADGEAEIVVTLISSTGGGNGSALQILLMKSLIESTFKREVLLGFSDTLITSTVSFVAEPYCIVIENPSPHAQMILGNAYAFRLESDLLLRQGAAKYVFHIGYSNPHGVVVSDSDLLGQVLGTSLYETQRNWEALDGILCNYVERLGRRIGYRGLDTIERFRNRESDDDLDGLEFIP